MKKNRIPLAVILIAAGCWLWLGLFPAGPAFAYDFAYWGHGSYGYDYAVTEAREKEKPLILYFHTPGSEWCEKMNTEYLASYDVEVFMIDIPKVEINPDAGEFEEGLAARYKIDNYPAFLVTIPAFEVEPRRIHPFSPGGDMRVPEFIKAMKDWIAYQYSRQAFSSYEKGKYEDSIRYYEIVLGLDPENLYAYYGLAAVYHALGYEKKDGKLLKKAEENYRKVLRIDKDHKESASELEKLKEDMKTLGLR